MHRAGVDLSQEELDALIDGIDAAADGFDSESWVNLVVETPPRALREALLGYRRTRNPARLEKPPAPAGRLAALRAVLKADGLDGMMVPRADAHQGEFVARQSERLAWLTGFTGSAGLAVILADRAALFVDGRYTLQARQQVDTNLIVPVHLADQPVEAWLAENLARDIRLGFDPWLHTPRQIDRMERVALDKGASLVPVERNPVDQVWSDRPPAPLGPVVPHDLAYAGQSSADKRALIARQLSARGEAAAVLTQPDSIAWLYNLRGQDVPHSPLALSFAVLRDDGGAELFMDPRKVTYRARQSLDPDVRLNPPDAFGPALDNLSGRRVRIDPASAAVWVFRRLEAAGAEISKGDDPCQLPKACKNPTEVAGTRQAHIRDGMALTRFLAWLDLAAPETVTELEAAGRLEAFRREDGLIRDLSFETISGAGPHGAVVHYRATPETDRVLDRDSLFLVDSGAQYPDGTTDVTRTVAIGTPSAEMRDRFTRVLKGHIALARARFPKGTTGSHLDVLARQYLWQAGLDYDHGTGHGVGSYLGVHEGPQRISKMPNAIALEAGMIVSNEPGYYKEGSYGIRIENLVVVTPLEAAGEGARELLGFETLTLAPIDRRLIEPSQMTGEEIAWMDAYHARVRETLAPLIADRATRDWLAGATAPLDAPPDQA